MNKPNRTSQKKYFFKAMRSPIGALKLVATDEGFAGILWENEKPGRVWLNAVAEDATHPLLVETETAAQ